MEVKEKPAWVSSLKRYEAPNTGKVALQLVDTLIPYFALLVLMYMTISWRLPYGVTLLIAVPAGALLVRMFIFFHDCCHGSYVRSQLGLKVLGNILESLRSPPTPTGATRTGSTTPRRGTWTAGGSATSGP